MMDQTSTDVVGFITALHQRDEKLRVFANKFWFPNNQVELRQTLGGHPCEPTRGREVIGVVFWNITITTDSDRIYSFSLHGLWDHAAWTITVRAWIDADEGGMDLLRSFPERTADSIDECLVNLDGAIDDLCSCRDLLPVSMKGH